MQNTTVVATGACRATPLLHPGGTPSVINEGAMVEVEVVRTPAELVTTKVARVGGEEIVGNAEALKKLIPMIGLYVLVARSEETISPTLAGTEVLKAYGGVVKEGVARGKLGSVVAIVTDSEEKKDETTLGDSAIVVAFSRG